MKKYIGERSILFEHPPCILGAASVAGQKESEGPLGEYFDKIERDPMCGGNSWEQAESLLQEKAASLAIKKAEYTEKLIMFANTYRSQFAEVARNCAKAELYFFDARFDEAIEMVKESLKRYTDISVFEYRNNELEGVTL